MNTFKKLGPHQVAMGDCLEVMKAIPNGSVDMILCDLPYGTTACKWDTVIPFEPLWEQYKRVIKANGAIVLTASQPFTTALIVSNQTLFRYDLIWHKTEVTGHLNANKSPMRAHENILVFYKSQPTYNPQKTQGHIRKTATSDRGKKNSECYGNQKGVSVYNSTERFPRSVLTFSGDKQKSKLHPTKKPVALMEYLIKTYTNEGETVLDNCAGSFTTGIACINTGRNFIGIEKDEHYYNIGVTRMTETLEDALKNISKIR